MVGRKLNCTDIVNTHYIRAPSMLTNAGIVLVASVSVCASVHTKTDQKLMQLGINMCYGES